MTITDSTTAGGLPSQFCDLERFSAWILERQDDRYNLRLASTMAEMQALYDTMMPRLPAIVEYLDQFPVDDLPEPARKLMLLTFSLVQASFPVEAWRQPIVPDAGAAHITCTREPLI
jgi:hypothetical protein